jgi:stress-induced-phosphoprotein 1
LVCEARHFPSPAMATAQEAKERGNAFYQRKQYAEAVACYSTAIELEPASHAVYTNRAAAHFALQNFEEALGDAVTSTALDDSWVKGYYRAGASLVALERYDDAVDAYHRGMAKDPTNAQVKSGLAHAIRLRNEKPRDKDDAKARGNECYKDGQYEDAIVWYSKAMAMCDAARDPDFMATLLTNR